MPGAAREALACLSQRFGLVGCISGRQAAEARRLVGLDGIAYAGNHGLELLLPGERGAAARPVARGARAAKRPASWPRSIASGCARSGCDGRTRGRSRPCTGAAPRTRRAPRVAPTRSRSRPDTPAWNRAGAARCWSCARSAAAARTRAVASLLADERLDRAVYAGDDRTDLDAFRRLRELRAAGELTAAVCVGVALAGGAGRSCGRLRPDRRRPGRLAGDPRMAGGVRSARCPTPNSCESPSSSPPPRRRCSGRSPRSAPTATAKTRSSLIAAAWWLVALAIGLYLAARAGRRTTSAPPSPAPAPPPRCRRRPRPASPPRRLWPIGLTALLAGVLGLFFPGVAAVGAGYALIVSLAWHTREAAVLAIEQRDGVKFYVVPSRPCAHRAGPHAGLRS